MAMSRKHYQAVAEIISDELSTRHPETDAMDAAAVASVERIAEELASFFKADNSSFDRQRFLAAAGL